MKLKDARKQAVNALCDNTAAIAVAVDEKSSAKTKRMSCCSPLSSRGCGGSHDCFAECGDN